MESKIKSRGTFYTDPEELETVKIRCRDESSKTAL